MASAMADVAEGRAGIIVVGCGDGNAFAVGLPAVEGGGWYCAGINEPLGILLAISMASKCDALMWACLKIV